MIYFLVDRTVHFVVNVNITLFCIIGAPCMSKNHLGGLF